MTSVATSVISRVRTGLTPIIIMIASYNIGPLLAQSIVTLTSEDVQHNDLTSISLGVSQPCQFDASATSVSSRSGLELSASLVCLFVSLLNV